MANTHYPVDAALVMRELSRAGGTRPQKNEPENGEHTCQHPSMVGQK